MEKETIELVKKMIEDGNLSQEIAEKYCPELKESKDEKIRKWLICTLKSLNNSPVQIDGAYEMMLPAIDWLEKKGKNNMGISEATKQKLEDNLNKALEKETPESWNKFLDEQNPAEWSEEDKKTIVKMRDFFIRVLGDKPDFTEDKRYEEFIEFIDNRLKSLRPQSQWMPSDEQMGALWSATEKYLESDDENVRTLIGEVLESLYNDLKKLETKGGISYDRIRITDSCSSKVSG